MSNFLSTGDFSRTELEAFVASAMELKAHGNREKPLAGRSVALVFFNPSLRTRASMQIGIYELGGNAVILEPGSTSWTLEHRDGVVMDSDKTEHLSEFVRVLERYVCAIGVRTFAALQDWNTEREDPVLRAFERYASVPVLNLESAMHHPFQAMADMMTIRESLGQTKQKVVLTWAWHPKPLPMAVPNSFALAAAQFGHDLTIAHPPGYQLDAQLMSHVERMASENGGSVTLTNDALTAFEGANVIYAKSWGASSYYGDAAEEVALREPFRKEWIVDEAKMARTADGVFMHCLPVRRNVIVTDGVIDSPRSLVIQEAENRLHIQKAVMSELLK